MSIRARLAAGAALVCCSGTALADVFSYFGPGGVLVLTNCAPHGQASEVVVVERPPDPEVIGRPPGVLAPPAARSRFDSLISAAAEATGVEGALLHAVISVESAYLPSAISKRGATGLMQLMPATARQYGTPDAFDPGQNINGGARYLKYLLKKYGDRIELVLAAYNAGESTVERYGGKVPPFKETVEYIDKVTRRYAELRQAPR